MFIAAARTKQCFLVAPRGSEDALAGSGLHALFHPISTAVPADDELPRAFACYREQAYPGAIVRPAVAEDYDDLMPIFERQSEKISARCDARLFGRQTANLCANWHLSLTKIPCNSALGLANFT
jgi:hypothetical protein